MTPLCISVEGKDLLVFENEELSVQRLKISFVCNLWSWSTVFVDVSHNSLVNFIDWLGSKQGQMIFFVSFLFPLR